MIENQQIQYIYLDRELNPGLLKTRHVSFELLQDSCYNRHICYVLCIDLVGSAGKVSNIDIFVFFC